MSRFILLSLLFFVSSFSLYAQPEPAPYGALPSQRQLNWQETDMYCIIHFSMATYTDKEWGYGDEDPNLFNPGNFDAMQIVGAAKDAGFKGIVVVAKHHDGFCLWPTKTTEHNISKSKWKNGKGDVVREYQLACQKLGMKMAIYCSPWDRNNPLYGKPEYVTQVYRKQLKELYENYGPLFMSWHDGANGGDGYYGGTREVRKIDRSTYYGWDTTWAITRHMQPGACIFGDIGPDVRWVGNEEGHAGETSWETYTPRAPDAGKTPSNGYVVSEEGTEGTRNGKFWMPAECDVPLRRGWFYHKAQDGQSKNAAALLDLYYKSVGRGACLDLGLSPDKDGKLSDEDVAILKEFGSLLRKTFTKNLAVGATIKASNIRGNFSRFGPQFLLDKDRTSYWATDDAVHTPELTLEFRHPESFNVIKLRENIRLGQRIEQFAVDAWVDGSWKQIASATSIGANRIIHLKEEVTTEKLRLRITKSPVSIALSEFGLYEEATIVPAPEMTRSKTGEITIAGNATDSEKGYLIRYTTSGKEPLAHSPKYTHALQFSSSVTVKAALFSGKTQKSEVTTRVFGLSKESWKILSVNTPNKEDLSQAIDEDPATVLRINSGNDPGDFKPQEVSVDLGKNHLIKGFTYLPPQDKKADGVVSRYTYYVSSDGKKWKEAIKGEFSNIASNPIEQTVSLNKPVKARFFKFEALRVVAGSGMAIAEIGVF